MSAEVIEVLTFGEMEFGIDTIEAMPLDARLTWSSALPMEVTLQVRPAHELPEADAYPPIDFTFARENLNAAVLRPGVEFGVGDVTVRGSVCECQAAHDELVFTTTWKGVRRCIFLDAEPVSHLLIRSFMIVPANCETVDVDAALAEIFKAEQ
jgi:hypothetical protein